MARLGRSHPIPRTGRRPLGAALFGGTINFSGFETGDGSELFISGNASVQTSVTRSGFYALRANPAGTATGSALLSTPENGYATYSTSYARFYFRFATKASSGREDIFAAYYISTLKLSLCLNSGGTLSVLDSAGSVDATGSTVLSADTWYRIEVRVGTGTDGIYEVLIDGVLEVSGTCDQTANLTDSLAFGKVANRHSNTVDYFYDDVFWSTAGFPGAGRVKLAVPSANGNYQTWSNSAGGSHYQSVDEIPPNTTDYLISTDSVGDAETEAMQNTATVGIADSIKAVKSSISYAKDGASSGLIKQRLRSGSTDSDGEILSSSSLAWDSRIFDRDPATKTLWTAAGFDGCEVGAVENDATNRTRLYVCYLQADYSGGFNFTDTPAGGLVLGGSPGPSLSVSPSGGLVLACTDLVVSVVQTPEGGVVLGGAVGLVTAFTVTPSGGVVLGGAPTITAAYAPAPSGGLVLACTDLVVWVVQIPEGGVVLGGAAAPQAAYAPAPTGGVVLGGAASPSVTRGTVQFSGLETGDLTEFKTSSGTLSVQGSTVRTGSYALRTNPTTTAVGYATLGTLLTTGAGGTAGIETSYVRFYFRYATKPSSASEPIFQASNAGAKKFALRIDSTGALKAYDSANSLLATGSTTLSSGTWYRLEAKVGTGTSADWEVKINGTSEISGTGNLGTNGTNEADFGKRTNENGQSVDFFYDDIRWADDAYPGVGECRLAVPRAHGVSTPWTGSGPGSHWEQLDDAPNNGDTDYVFSDASVGSAEMMAMQSAATAGISGVIAAVKAVVVVKSHDSIGSDIGSVKARLRSGSTNDDGAAYATVVGSYQVLQRVYSLDPATWTAWSTSSFNTCEVGAVENSGLFESRMTAVYLEADFASGQPSPEGGLILGGAASPVAGYTFSPTGGLVLGAAASPLADYAPGPTGGIVLGGTVSLVTAFTVTTEGGLILGGTVTAFVDLGVSGGLVLGGVVGLVTGFGVTTEGGLVLGGAAGPLADYSPSPTGGVVLGGAISLVAGFTVTTEGGLVLGGSVVPLVGIDVSGGLILGGAPSVLAAYVPAPTGGLVFSASVSPLADYAPPPSGGLVLGGAVGLSAGFSVSTAGGLVLSASVSPIFPITVSGGLTLGGGAIIPNLVYEITPSGGIIVGGATPTVIDFIVTTSGGLVITGVTEISLGKFLLRCDRRRRRPPDCGRKKRKLY